MGFFGASLTLRDPERFTGLASQFACDQYRCEDANQRSPQQERRCEAKLRKQPSPFEAQTDIMKPRLCKSVQPFDCVIP
jgi:hypothetical protein